MFAHTPRRGATLMELATVLALVAVALAVALPPARGLRDRLTVATVRDEVLALLLRARAEAPLLGGTRVEFLVADGEVRLFSGDSLVAGLPAWARYRVRVDLGEGRERAEVAYDPMGLGRVASRTVVFARGRARDTLRISSYGRVAR